MMREGRRAAQMSLPSSMPKACGVCGGGGVCVGVDVSVCGGCVGEGAGVGEMG